VQRLAVAGIIQPIANDSQIMDELQRRQTGAAFRRFDRGIDVRQSRRFAESVNLNTPSPERSGHP